MEKIIQIEYQGRKFSIEEKAYEAFNQYETALKKHFEQDSAGEEIIADLQYRMAEILQERSKEHTLSINDIEELKAIIGNPSDFETENSEESFKENTYKDTNDKKEKKKLFRNKKDKVIAGVCSGIAHYFSIDPIAVRILFLLFTVFNAFRFFSFNMGILAYIVLWVVLTPAYLRSDISKKLFRNPKDKVLGGVCSGIATFFNIETWIIRLIFVVPLLIGIFSHNTHFGPLHVNWIGDSFTSLAMFSYIIFWILIPEAKMPTDYMLLKGEPININTIQNQTAMSDIQKSGSTGINRFLKIVAYAMIVLLLLVLIPAAIGLFISLLFGYQLADIVLFTETNKVMALLVIILFIGLPILSIIVWLIRRILGLKQSKILRAVAVGLHIMGWVALFYLISFFSKEYNTYSSYKENIQLNNTSDTLYINGIDMAEENIGGTYFIQWNRIEDLIKKGKNENKIKSLSLKYVNTEDSNFTMQIERGALGSNKQNALQNCKHIPFRYEFQGKQLLLPAYVEVSNKYAYHMEHVHVIIYVPKGKKVITNLAYLNEINQTIKIGKRQFGISRNKKNYEKDYIFVGGEKYTELDLEINGEEEIKSKEDSIKIEMKHQLDSIKQVEKDLKMRRKDLEKEIRKD